MMRQTSEWYLVEISTEILDPSLVLKTLT